MPAPAPPYPYVYAKTRAQSDDVYPLYSGASNVMPSKVLFCLYYLLCNTITYMLLDRGKMLQD